MVNGAPNPTTFAFYLLTSTLGQAQALSHPVGGLGLEHVAAVVGDVVAALDDQQLARPRDFGGDALRVVRRREVVELAPDHEDRAGDVLGRALERQRLRHLAR